MLLGTTTTRLAGSLLVLERGVDAGGGSAEGPAAGIYEGVAVTESM